jgi:hypothetical protein
MADIATTTTEKCGLQGIECPECGCRKLPVLYTRYRRNRVVRFRQCHGCHRRVMTYEEVQRCVSVHRKK